MEKIKFCVYWEKKICKFMNNTDKCCYAHCINDLKKINCKYGINCCNSKCVLNHGDIVVYDIPIVKIKTFCNPNFFENETNKIPDNNILDINKNNINNVIIIKKEDNINDIVYYLESDYNKILSYIDNYYIEKINKNNQYFRNTIIKNYGYTTFLRNKNQHLILENKNLRLKYDQLKKEKEETKLNNTHNTQLIESKNININRLTTLYNKYIDLYNIFKNNDYNYKNINMSLINDYTNDKNIYMIKQRATKV